MAPLIAQGLPDNERAGVESDAPPQPLKYSGSLDCLESFDVTTVIGTEFLSGVQLAQLLVAPNSDNLLRDLALLGINPRFLQC